MAAPGRRPPHPLDDGTAPALIGSVADTAARVGADGPTWRRVFEPLARAADPLAAELLGPALHLPRHPIPLAQYGPSSAAWPRT